MGQRGRALLTSTLVAALAVALAGPTALAEGRWKTSPAETHLISQISTSKRNLQYSRTGDARHTMDVFMPKHAAGKNVPVILWIHGGAWRAGDKGWVPGLRSMLEAGFAVASVNYRLAPAAVFPAQIDDCREAVRYLRRNAAELGIASDRIGVWGESAGGHLAALLGTTAHLDESARVSAVCDWYGPTEMVSMGFLSAVLKARGGGDPVGDLLGGALEHRDEAARLASPLTYVTPAAVPFLIMHGNADVVVPVNQSQLLVDALKKVGAEVEFVLMQGAKHTDDRFLQPESIRRVISFFQKHLNSESVDAGDISQESVSPG